MATTNGTNYAKSINNTGENILAPGTLGGRVRVLTESITFSEVLADGDSVRIGRQLRDGAIILGVEIHHGALGGALTISLGDADSATRYLSTVAAAAAGVISTVDMEQAGVNYTIGTNYDDNIILLTCDGGIPAAVTGVAKIYYTED